MKYKYRLLHLDNKMYQIQRRKYLFGIIPIRQWESRYLPCESIEYVAKMIPKNTKIKIIYNWNQQ